MRTTSIKLIGLLLMLGTSEVHAFDLLDAWQNARIQDPVYGVARSEAEVGRTKSLQAKALRSLQVTAKAGVGGISSDNKITDAQFSAPGMGSASGASFRTKTDAGLNMNWNIRAEYPLYDVARSSSANQLNKQAQLAEVQLSADEQQLMLRVAEAYFDTLMAEDTLSTVQNQLKAVAKALEIAKARFEEGDAAIIETHETQARYDILIAQELEAQSNQQVFRATLADLTNDQNSSLIHLSPKANLQRYAIGDLKDWLGRARMSNQRIQVQQLQQDIAHAEIGKHQAQNSPVLNLVAQAGGERLDGLGTSDANLTNRQASLGLQLTIPLYTGGMRDAKYQEALALEDKARNQTEAVRLLAVREARSAWLGVSVGKSQIKALEQAERSAQIKLDSTRLGHDVGDRTTLDVLNSEQELFNTQLSLYRARYQVLQALLNLSAAAGELNEARLKEINQAFRNEPD